MRRVADPKRTHSAAEGGDPYSAHMFEKRLE